MSVVHQDIESLERRVGQHGDSPLFAQLAFYYLQQSRTQDALRLCDAGLANFPFYTTGHLIKGKALQALKMYAEARREFEFVLEFLPHNDAVKKLLEHLPAREEILAAPAEPEPVPPEPEPAFQPPAVMEHPTVSTRTVGIPPVAAELPPAESFDFTAPEPAPQAPSFPIPAAEPTVNPFEAYTSIPFPAQTAEPAPAETENNPFADFSFTPPATTPIPELQNFAQEQSMDFDFSFAPLQDASAEMKPEEPFEAFAERTQKELSGKNSLSLEDYFSAAVQSVSQEPVHDKMLGNTLPLSALPEESNKIEELAEKLQSAGKITPVMDFVQKETPVPVESEPAAGVGFVTPTLAEIYAKQGWYDDAIKAYKTLAQNKPADRERYEQRVAELEELKKQAGPQ